MTDPKTDREVIAEARLVDGPYYIVEIVDQLTDRLEALTARLERVKAVAETWSGVVNKKWETPAALAVDAILAALNEKEA